MWSDITIQSTKQHEILADHEVYQTTIYALIGNGMQGSVEYFGSV